MSIANIVAKKAEKKTSNRKINKAFTSLTPGGGKKQRAPQVHKDNTLTEEIAIKVQEQQGITRNTRGALNLLAFALHIVEGYSRGDIERVIGCNTASQSMLINKIKRDENADGEWEQSFDEDGEPDTLSSVMVENLKKNFDNLIEGKEWARHVIDHGESPAMTKKRAEGKLVDGTED